MNMTGNYDEVQRGIDDAFLTKINGATSVGSGLRDGYSYSRSISHSNSSLDLTATSFSKESIPRRALRLTTAKS